MTDELIDIARRRLHDLKAELSKYAEFREYEELSRFVATAQRLRSLKSGTNQRSSLAGHTKLPPLPTQNSRPRERDPRIVPAVEAILREADGGPMPLREIYSRLRARGIEIAGKNPEANLSAKLSYSQRFVSRGPAGWILATPDHEADRQSLGDPREDTEESAR